MKDATLILERNLLGFQMATEPDLQENRIKETLSLPVFGVYGLWERVRSTFAVGPTDLTAPNIFLPVDIGE